MTNGTSPCSDNSSLAAINWTNTISANWTNTTSASSFNCTEINEAATMIGSDSNQSLSVFDVISQVHMYGTLTIVPVGVFLNILSIVIFVKSKLAWTPVGLHMMYLAIADNLILVSILIRVTLWRYYLIHFYDLYSLNIITCVGTYYSLEVGFTWSSFLLISVTIERFLSIAFPLKVKTWNLYRKSKTLMGTYLILSLILSGYTVLGFNIITIDNTNVCVYSERYKNIFYISNIIMNVVFANGLAFSLILVFTIMTAVALNKYKQKRERLGFTSNDTGREFRLTVMLFTVALLFLVLRVGEMIVHFLMLDKNLPASVAEMVVGCWPIFILLVLINHAVNFIVYVIFLAEFRRTFRRILARGRKVEPDVITHGTS